MKLVKIKGSIVINGKRVKKHGRLPVEKGDIGISIEQIKEYFKDVKYRGIYFVTLKQEAANKLREAGYSVMQIGEIINTHYTNVIHLVNKRKEDAQCFEVKYRWKELIEEGIYPITVGNTKYHKVNQEYERYISVTYIDKSELMPYICNN